MDRRPELRPQRDGQVGLVEGKGNSKGEVTCTISGDDPSLPELRS